jgi:hypothetical protein
VTHHRHALFLVLVSFIASFGFIRVSARISRSPRMAWWPGSVVSDSGLHLHHLVWGICLMLAGGVLGFALYHASPWLEISGCLFGIGAGMTLDEFALWVYLDDVYWAREGRASIDAAVLAAAVMLLVLLGAQPFEVSTKDSTALIFTLSVIVMVVALMALCFAKLRVLHGVLGLFFFPIAIYGVVRIAKPGSPWAKRRYRDRNPAKQAKAEARFAPGRRTERFKEWVRDKIGGTTDEVFEARQAERAAGQAKAAAELREQAAVKP